MTDKDPSTIAVVGPGAIGCLIAAGLAAGADNTVLLVDHDSERAAFLNRRGLIVERHGKKEKVDGLVVTTAAHLTQPVDYIFLTVKSNAVADAVDQIRPQLANCRLLVAMQNGIGHLDTLAAFPRSAAAVTAMGAYLKGQGHVVHAGTGPTSIGGLGAAVRPDCLTAVAHLLDHAGFPATVSTDIHRDIWQKLLVNVGINALTAILDCANGELLDNDWACQTMVDAITEAVAVARATGVTISGDPVDRARSVCQATAANISSMLQDVRRQRPTEIDAINGAVVRLARRYGLTAPVNAMLTEKVHDIEARYPVAG